MTLRINCWSGPRNISTALMYSFRERSDTTVVDEPFYAHYLRTSERKHPGYEEILSSQEQYSEEVIQNVIRGNYSTPIVFFKQMCHHLVEMDLSFIDNCLNVLLIREPSLVIRSHAKNVPDLQVSDIGLDVQNHLLNRILESGMSPVVIDSAILLERPESVLKELCQILEITFEKSMLSWEPGPKPEDGIWAKHWYKNTHESSGFSNQTPNRDPLPEKFLPVLEEATVFYENLKKYACKGID
ncbi:MAG: sulfotransferase family protein [Actinomycetota bacterium]|jgi:hypothetical protein|nr:hypothetical protein [Acidimicrobiales bacterium]MEC7899979.1 sulfotransferase family protein [Actinomycetota bacterium]